MKTNKTIKDNSERQGSMQMSDDLMIDASDDKDNIGK